MPQVQLPDRLYEEATEYASEAGFPSLEDFIADALQQRMHEPPLEIDGDFFTPEVIAKLDKAAAQAEVERLVTFEELRARIAAKQNP